MTVTGRHAGSATRLLCTLQTALAVPAGVLLAGRMPAGHAVGAALAAMATGAALLGPRLYSHTRRAARGHRPPAPGPWTRAVLSLGLGAVAGAGLAAGPALTAPAVAGLVLLLACAAAFAPPPAPAGTVLVWSAGPPLGVFVALLAGTGAVFGALAALNTVALALLVAGPSAPLTACAARLARLRRLLLTTPATREPWPAGQRRWVNQRTP
ncbi:hypothetical protein ACFVX6_22365 [Streptomyces sp. NPDC058289]|uniref:hypothetical protein n=1 Tax=Streptomyces sp. NPDC058289 TaxID=3346425 RepID=UPI0036EE46DC